MAMASPSQGIASGDFLDINRHVRTLLARWKAIALGTVLCAVLAGVGAEVLSNARPEYRATVDVICFPEEVLYVHDQPAEPPRRITAFVGLVRQGSVATAVRERLGEALPGASAANLLSRVRAELVPYQGRSSDLIRITTMASTPQLATRLGDLWAEEFAKHVNRVYAPVPPAAFSAIEAELEAAEAALAEAQGRLEAFLRDDNPAALEQEMEAYSALAAQLREMRSPSYNEALRSVLEKNRTILLQRIADLERSGGNLAARVEAANGTLAKLELDRDAAAAALEDLQRKKAELRLEKVSFFGEVAVASTAILAGSTRRGPLTSAIVAALLALPLFGLLALVVPRRDSDAASSSRPPPSS